jgi:kinesin family protein 2/24
MSFFIQIYDLAVRPLVDSAFQGAKVTCFAYGQTGSGKTYTMNGNNSQGNPGLYTLGAQDIFYYLENVFFYLTQSQFKHLKAKLSFYEIYCGKLFDLLNKRNELKLREDNKNNINIIGLEEATVTSTE